MIYDKIYAILKIEKKYMIQFTILITMMDIVCISHGLD